LSADARPLAVEARPRVTLICGRSGAGKTTFAIRYLLNARDVSLRMIWDPAGEYAQRLRLPPQRTVLELDLGIRRGWCLWGTDLWPGDADAAFEAFCDAAWEYAGHMPRRTIVLVDEVWKYCTPMRIPHALAVLVQEGRKRRVETVFLTQRPNRLNESILGEVTECVVFPLTGERGLMRVVQTCDVPEDEVERLRPGEFVSVSDRGARLQGKLF
jgi:hypothetical protein